jgi:argininosuccinate lyase
MRAVEPGIDADVYTVLSPEQAVASRTSFGGTAPELVREAVREGRKRHLGEKDG